ncbi:MAG: 2-dehydro-3-deoxygalactonokinase [Pseudomonadota bacterium]|nr:2-dehydro-3-deoxygalactonokinase [Pseudomonadota bacterium]
MDDVRLIAIDWGTSSARSYALGPNGKVLRERSAPLGVQRMNGSGFEDALRVLCGGEIPVDIPLIASGMIGSRQGWIEAPYCECPTGFDAVAAALTRVPGTRLAIVPGLICRGDVNTPDVIRGEETQVFGALSERVGARQVVVLPGTHSKWVIAGPKGIEIFATFMTGELYAVLQQHSILGRLAATGVDDAAFDRGVRHSLRREAALTHDLFSARTLALTDALAPTGVADYLSGLLLGAEIAASQLWLEGEGLNGESLTLLGEAALLTRYRRALALADIDSVLGPPDAAARGLWRVARHAGMVSDD